MLHLLSVFLLLQSSTSAPASSAEPVACELLTQAQLSQATGATIGAGTPISRPGTCQWSGGGKTVTLTINQLKNGKTPVDQFNDGKKGMMGVTTEAVSGVGDDAFYIYFTGTTRACGLVVKKGTSVFEIRLYGFELDQAKTITKTLATQAAAKF